MKALGDGGLNVPECLTSRMHVESMSMTSRRHLKSVGGWLGGVVAKVGLGGWGKHFVWVSKCGETYSR